MLKDDQTMKLTKVRFKDYISKDEYRSNPRTMYRAAVKSLTVMTNKHLIANVVSHTGLKEAQIASVLLALPLAVRDYALAGDAVQILNLFTIKPSIKSKAVYTESECTADTILTKKINAIAIGDMAAVSSNWKFKMTDEIVNGEPVTSGSVDEGDEGDESE